MGILIYAFFATGLGCWLKLTSRSGLNMLGLRLSLGYAAMLLIMYIAQAVLSLPGAMSFWLLFALAAGGIIVRL